MSLDQDVSGDSEGIHSKEVVALTILEWLNEDSSEMILASEIMMLTSQNHNLLEFTGMLEDIWVERGGEEVADWLKRGLSAVYLYFHYVSEDIDKKVVPAIEPTAVDEAGRDLFDLKRRGLLAGEFLQDNDLETARLHMGNEIFDRIDKNVMIILMETRRMPENQEVSEECFRAFVEGVVIMNLIFEKQAGFDSPRRYS